MISEIRKIKCNAQFPAVVGFEIDTGRYLGSVILFVGSERVGIAIPLEETDLSHAQEKSLSHSGFLVQKSPKLECDQKWGRMIGSAKPITAADLQRRAGVKSKVLGISTILNKYGKRLWDETLNKLPQMCHFMKCNPSLFRNCTQVHVYKHCNIQLKHSHHQSYPKTTARLIWSEWSMSQDRRSQKYQCLRQIDHGRWRAARFELKFVRNSRSCTIIQVDDKSVQYIHSTNSLILSWEAIKTLA